MALSCSILERHCGLNGRHFSLPYSFIRGIYSVRGLATGRQGEAEELGMILSGHGRSALGVDRWSETSHSQWAGSAAAWTNSKERSWAFLLCPPTAPHHQQRAKDAWMWKQWTSSCSQGLPTCANVYNVHGNNNIPATIHLSLTCVLVFQMKTSMQVFFAALGFKVRELHNYPCPLSTKQCAVANWKSLPNNLSWRGCFSFSKFGFHKLKNSCENKLANLVHR